MADRLLLINQASEEFGIPAQALRELVKKGFIPSIIIRNTTRIRYNSMLNFLEKYDGKNLSNLNNVIEVSKEDIDAEAM